MTDTLFDEIKAKVQKAALTGAMAAQSVMGVGVTPQAENIDDKPTVQPVEQTVSAQPQETTDDILYGAFEAPVANTVSPQPQEMANDILYDAFEQPNEVAAPVDDRLYDVFTESTTANTDASENASLEDKYGFDMRYSDEHKVFALSQDGATNLGVRDIDIDPQAWQAQNQELMDKTFTGKTEYMVEHVDLYEYLSDQFEGRTKEDIKENYFFVRASYNQNNGINSVQYDIAPENYDKCVDLMCQSLDMDKETAAKIIDRVTDPNSVDPITYMSRMDHEDSHRFDHQNNKTFQYDLHPEYMAKLDMLSEVRANIVQAGLAYDMYKATGNLNHFDALSIDTKEIKEALAQNPNMENPKEFIAQSVFNKWMDTYNRDDSPYSQLAYDHVSPKNTTYPLYAFVKSPEAEKEYHERVAEMFKDIYEIGDVRQCIDPDFKLNDKLQDQLTADIKDILPNDNLRQLMAQNIAEGEYISKDFTEYAQAVREVYKDDGIRTPDETARLGKILQDKLKTSEPLDVTKISEEDKTKIAALSGRSGKYQSPAQQTAEPQTLNRETKQASAMYQPASPTIQAQAAQEMPAPKAPSMETAPNIQAAPEIKAPNTQAAPEIKAQSAEKAPNSTPAPQKQTVGELSPQEKGEFFHGLRNGKNMFLDRAEGKVTPPKDRSKVKAPQQNTVLNLKMQQQQTQRT